MAKGNGADGPSLGGGGGGSVDIVDEVDIWSYRDGDKNLDYFAEVIEGVREINEDFPGVMDETISVVNATTFGGMDAVQTLGVYSAGSKSVGINTNYTDVNKMNRVYDKAVADGYHPSRGNKSGTEAVTLHEMGHGLTDHLAKKNGRKVA